MQLILASKSPRRREILGAMGYRFDILTSEADETLPEGMTPREGVELLAIRKGAAVAETLSPDADVAILSSDTLVDLGGVALGKPIDEEDAFRMLKALSGAGHYVHTGVAVRHGDTVVSGVDSTAVYFRPLADEEIRAYIATGDPMDKAGSYGIQGAAGAFVRKIEGDFDTVMGLSSRLSEELLSKIGVEKK